MSSLCLLLLLFYWICSGSCQELKILVGDESPAIYDVGIQANQISVNKINIVNISRPIAIDYDADSDVMYWTDVKLHQIWSRNLGTFETRLILNLYENAIMDGLALDVGRRKLFYTDTGNDVIASINTDGTNHVILIATGLDEPRAIVLYEERRQMYWSDWGNKPYIATADYDGTGITKLVTTGLGWPNGLTLDRKDEVLYWCDGKTHKIEAVYCDGSERRLVLEEPGAHYFGIFYHNEALFITDWERRFVVNVPARHGGRVGRISNSNFGTLTGIHVFSAKNFSDCQVGQYGRDCSECGHCAEGSVCDKTTGACLAGCSDGYQGITCTEKCNVGSYGQNCEMICGNCRSSACNHVTGVCEKGCAQIQQTVYCKTSCPSNTYGPSCTPCGQCKDRVSCDVTSGYCPTGCSKGWTGSRCAKENEFNDFDESTKRNNYSSFNRKSTINWVIVAAVPGFLVVLAIIIAVVVVLVRRKPQVPNSDRTYTTLEAHHGPTPYSVTGELPPPYSSINHLQVHGGRHPPEARTSDHAPSDTPTPDLAAADPSLLLPDDCSDTSKLVST